MEMVLFIVILIGVGKVVICFIPFLCGKFSIYCG